MSTIAEKLNIIKTFKDSIKTVFEGHSLTMPDKLSEVDVKELLI